MQIAADAVVNDARSDDRDHLPHRLWWMLAFFVTSGMCGLIYQSIWSQYLNLILGSSAYAQSLVLAIFMGGMAIGAWLSAHLVARWRDLFLAYGGIEAAVGVAGVGFHAVFLLVTGWLYGTAIPGLANPESISALRWAAAAALIVPQTVLLGMTFPIMSAALMRWTPQRAGAVLGGLYFYNSIGAAFGALLATFVLVPRWGLAGAMAIAGIVNIAIYLGIWYARIEPRGAEARESSGVAVSGRQPGFYALMLAAAALTGLSSFMYEIGWVRMLSLALGSSLHAFELMLAAFIGGLALGGLYIRKHLDRIAAPIRYVGFVQIFMGMAALATLPLYDHSFAWVGWLLETLAPTSSGYFFYNVATAAISIAIMLPAAFFAGMTLPIMTYVLLRRGAGEPAVGHVYAANTLGAILGVILMTHVAMPMLGLKVSLIVAASIDLALGLILLGAFGEIQRRRSIAIGGALSLALLVFAIGFADFDPRRLNSGVFRTGNTSIAADSDVFYQADGKTASIALFGVEDRVLTIATNGKPDASIAMQPGAPPTLDEPTMILAAILGLAFHPDPERIANIGFGSGLTTHTFASSSLPDNITTVEIEPKMVEAARGFGARVARAYDDPRSQIVIDDARAYFSGAGERYDVIVSEPSNPWVSGVAKLFSVEFYSFVRRHLTDDGLLVQWVQTYEVADATLLTVLRALDASFSDYALYISNGTDLLIVATPQGKLPQPNGRFLSDAAMRPLADAAGIRGVADIHARKIADRAVIGAMLRVDGGPINSDFRPVLAHWAPRDRFKRASAQMILSLHDSPLGIYSLQGHYPPNHPQAWMAPPVPNLMVDKRRVAAILHQTALGRPGSSIGSENLDANLIARGLGERLQELGASCFASGDEREMVQALIRAFQLTAPYLDDAARRELWQSRSWMSCTESGKQTLDAVLATFEALVANDVAGIERHSWQVLRDGSGKVNSTQMPYFAHSALYGAIRSGSSEGQRLVWDHARDELELKELGLFELRMTEAIVGGEQSPATVAPLPAAGASP